MPPLLFEYNQPNLNDYVTQHFDIGRIRQILVSAGDIFESPVSARAFALGPESDISKVTIGYVNAVAQSLTGSLTNPTPTNLAQFTLTPERAFSGFLPALNTERGYQPGGVNKVPGRILLWSSDFYDATYLPLGFSAGNDGLIRERPVFDVVQFFSDPGSLQSPRSDKTYYYDSIPFTTDDSFVMIPFFGRRLAQVFARNTGNNCDMILKGVNFRISDPATAPYGEVTLDTDTIASGATGRQFVHANTDGFFDYLILQFDPAAATRITLRVTVSDRD